MKITTLFGAGFAAAAVALPALALAQVPPAPPVPPSPSAAFAPVAPPAPPTPPRPPGAMVWGSGGSEVISRNENGQRITIVARRPGSGMSWGGDNTREVLSYKDADGKDVRVFSNKPVTREQVETMRTEARETGARARAEGERARAEGQRAREQGRLAREEGRRARERSIIIRREAMDEAMRGRDFANLGPRDVRIFTKRDGDPMVMVDGQRMPGFGPGFPFAAGGPDMAALREEMRQLREELKSLRAELDRERTRR